MLKLILIRGLPGSGKSTLAKQLKIHHYEADMYFVDKNGDYLFQPEQLPVAHQWCLNMTRQSLSTHHSVVVSNTFVMKWEMMPYVALAKQYGAQLDVIECHNDFGSVHGVTPETIERMKARWQVWVEE
ncbi:ATP-binding protein [Vibrio ostreicida]|uniref:ATP-binding protein n=1 Tax=Vibrio ostreicida TaxID=526588 RepID=A0ABT8BTQ3_9VIBR|nr:ATP-binding protein [Vibrio ostreicida]MDN3610137.1 ATP-binding protein [Vibrio ostreicida]NPD07838.1 ATP-binding protein [Vibrio ostreicida]